NIGAPGEKTEPTVFAGDGIAAFRIEPVLAKHVERNDGKRRDRLARDGVGDEAGDTVLGLQHDRPFRRSAANLEILVGESLAAGAHLDRAVGCPGPLPSAIRVAAALDLRVAQL